jgi:hypothetical protein
VNRDEKILRWAVRIFVLLMIFGVILPGLAGSRESTAVIRALPFGWLNFLQRTLPEVTVNWAGIGMVALCSAAILACLHSLLKALTKERFRFRWSMAIFASPWLLFCLIIAVTGVSRTIPLLRNETWYRPRSGYGELRNASMHATMALNEGGTDPGQLRRLLMDTNRWRPLWEEFEFLICAPGQGKSPSIIVIPRDEKVRNRSGFSIVTDSESEDSIPIDKLEEKLGKLRISVLR